MSPINQWPAQERPREKLLHRGPQALSDAELLAIFLRTGTRGKNVIELARDIIQHFGGLKKLFAANLESFCQIKGLGEAKYVQLQACMEMSQRHLAEELTHSDVIQNPTQVKAFVQSRLMRYSNEVFAVLFLDNQHRILAFEELFFGTINASTVHPRVILQRALSLNAAAIIMSHNHPSGLAEASVSDIDITHCLKKALSLVDIRVLDHLIVASHQVISMAEQGHI
ncbi:RadC family protein [Aliikangiella coralliicola]|uniref:JAB domain-containing protein n=1 Tax=Aliikangiella coralliicola TaxID=2592383 RepID=A0A545UHM2_9GAMM|nr:DNA repair protein RadC [Aliikangiella coralliicola]TQV88965.1 JAB domain-containing protein [Aliikangiella coralliicola]